MNTNGARRYGVLFLCTGNSARSIMAEAILNQIGDKRFAAYSAGSRPLGQVNLAAIRLLKHLDYRTDGLQSKSIDDVLDDRKKVPIDFVFTLCDSAVQECPLFPNTPMQAHWGIDDPAIVEGSDAEVAAAFADAYRMLHNRISVFVNLPIETIDRLSLQEKLKDMGQDRRG